MENLDAQLTKYLTDAHSIEEQALAQLRSAPEIAVVPRLAEAFKMHLAETEHHEAIVRDLLASRGAAPSRLKDTAMKLGGKGFVLFAKSQPDTPGKLAAHAFSYEHLEQASYELLALVAEKARATDVKEAAEKIAGEEREMADRIAAAFGEAADVSLAQKADVPLGEQLDSYLADAHAIEAQAMTLLSKAADTVADAQLEEAFRTHLVETERHSELVADRLSARGSSPSRLKDAAMKMGGFNWSTFFKAHRDTTGKLAAFAYAFEHLEIAGYAELERVAVEAGDPETANLAKLIRAQEEEAAVKLRGLFDRAVTASLAAVA
jgi:ferritin-like metal-binding protein YciE